MEKTVMDLQCIRRTCLVIDSSIYDICYVAVVALLFFFHQQIIANIMKTIKSYMKNKHSNPEVLKLGCEVERLKHVLSQISPISEFSLYFKTERLLNKVVEQYDAAVAKENMMKPSHAKIEMGLRVVAQGIGLALLHTVSGVYAFCISSTVFWPFNVLLRFPKFWKDSSCIFQGDRLPEQTPVSVFVLMYCGMVAVRKCFFLGRFESSS